MAPIHMDKENDHLGQPSWVVVPEKGLQIHNMPEGTPDWLNANKLWIHEIENEEIHAVIFWTKEEKIGLVVGITCIETQSG